MGEVGVLSVTLMFVHFTETQMSIDIPHVSDCERICSLSVFIYLLCLKIYHCDDGGDNGDDGRLC